MPIYRPFKGWPRSRRVTRARYPEEWAWWAASGWQMIAEDAPGGGLHLHTYREVGTSSTLWGGSIPATEAASRELVQRFLREALLLHLHPRRAARALAAFGLVCTDDELAAFVRQQRRRAARNVTF